MECGDALCTGVASMRWGRSQVDLSMLKLFYAPGSCARASHIALREAGADFELRFVDFAVAEQRTDAYKKVNPKGRVPALETEHGVITENMPDSLLARSGLMDIPGACGSSIHGM